MWTVSWDPRPLCVLKVGAGCEAIVSKVTRIQGGGMGNTLVGGKRPKSKRQGPRSLRDFLLVGRLGKWEQDQYTGG